MNDDWVEVGNVNWLHQALLLKSVLEDAGIEALIPDEHTLSIQPAYAPILGGVRIMVRAAAEEKARDILLASATADPAADTAAAIEAIAEAARSRTRGIIAALVASESAALDRVTSAIARAAHRDLERVDLAALVSKYAGEVEKRLDRVFADAEKSGAILLFEESDALFDTHPDAARDRGTGRTVTRWLLSRRTKGTSVLLLAVSHPDTLDDPFFRAVDYTVSCT
jgi:hypothetical protein